MEEKVERDRILQIIEENRRTEQQHKNRMKQNNLNYQQGMTRTKHGSRYHQVTLNYLVIRLCGGISGVW